MANDHNEDTEFNDALRARGIIPPKPPSREPSPDIPHITHADAIQAVAATADASTLTNLLEGDGLDSDDERIFEEYKRKRMDELRNDEKKGKYGFMMPLGRDDFVREVTEGSQAPHDGEAAEEDDDDDEEEGGQGESSRGKLRGTGVVVFLFKDSIPLSQHFRPLLNQLAAAHPSTKFLSIPADMCIPNYPDKNVPTLLIYRNGDVVGNVVAGMGLKGLKTTVREMEMLLLHLKAIEKPSPALRQAGRDEADGSDDDLEDTTGTVNTKAGGLRGSRPGVASKGDDSDSDFDI